jgi:predicted metal-dependent phosphoesterase TrpH
MLGYQRTKRVSIWTEGTEKLVAHGILDDDIYSLEVRFTIAPLTREILEMEGWWNRWTTPDCTRSSEMLGDAVGVRIDEPGLGKKLQKGVGRKGCRHYANIIIECCHAAREALEVLDYEEARKRNPSLGFAEFSKTGAGKGTDHESPTEKSGKEEPHKGEGPGPVSAGRNSYKSLDGPVIDIHVHTSPASPCSSAPVDALIEEAKRIGLDGICLTDHNHTWKQEEVDALSRRHDFLVLRGNEITTDQGDMLVFGFDTDVKGIIRLEDLKRDVLDAGGIIIAAHPFRGFLTFGVEKLGLTPEKAKARELFQYVDAVEVLNGKVTPRENAFSGEVAELLGYPVTGGSDAHEVDEVGLYATRFGIAVQSEKDLIGAVKKGLTEPVAFRKDNGR